MRNHFAVVVRLLAHMRIRICRHGSQKTYATLSCWISGCGHVCVVSRCRNFRSFSLRPRFIRGSKSRTDRLRTPIESARTDSAERCQSSFGAEIALTPGAIQPPPFPEIRGAYRVSANTSLDWKFRPVEAGRISPLGVPATLSEHAPSKSRKWIASQKVGRKSSMGNLILTLHKERFILTFCKKKSSYVDYIWM